MISSICSLSAIVTIASSSFVLLVVFNHIIKREILTKESDPPPPPPAVLMLCYLPPPPLFPYCIVYTVYEKGGRRIQDSSNSFLCNKYDLPLISLYVEQNLCNLLNILHIFIPLSVVSGPLKYGERRPLSWFMWKTHCRLANLPGPLQTLSLWPCPLAHRLGPRNRLVGNTAAARLL